MNCEGEGSLEYLQSQRSYVVQHSRPAGFLAHNAKHDKRWLLGQAAAGAERRKGSRTDREKVSVEKQRVAETILFG